MSVLIRGYLLPCAATPLRRAPPPLAFVALGVPLKYVGSMSFGPTRNRARMGYEQGLIESRSRVGLQIMYAPGQGCKNWGCVNAGFPKV